MSNLIRRFPTTTWIGYWNKRLLTTYPHENVKIKVNQTKDNETYIEAEPIPSGREGRVINVVSSNNPNACALCRLNLRNLHYTDVMILSQWIKKDGSIATYEESKLCTKQYKKITKLVQKAQRCNLIKRPADYFVPGGWHDLNTYLEPDRRRDQPMKVVRKEYWKL